MDSIRLFLFNQWYLFWNLFFFVENLKSIHFECVQNALIKNCTLKNNVAEFSFSTIKSHKCCWKVKIIKFDEVNTLSFFYFPMILYYFLKNWLAEKLKVSKNMNIQSMPSISENGASSSMEEENESIEAHIKTANETFFFQDM